MAGRLSKIFGGAERITRSGAFIAGGVFLVTNIHCAPKHIQAGKQSQAKNGIGAIARGVVRAYEGTGLPEDRPGILCASASPTPRYVPRGKKVQPSTTEGEDFNTGTNTYGWRCLEFTLAEPLHYRFDYRAGGGYLGPARGGIDPGPDGFEASAEGDLDGDGKTSLFVLTGRIDREKNVIVMDQPRSFDEDE